jgi:hypothetical protein
MSPYGPNAFMMAMLPAEAYDSMCTALVQTNVTQPSGQTIQTYLPSVDPNLVNIMCRKAPLIEERPSGGEVVTDLSISNRKEEAVVLKEYRPEIHEKMRLRVDGVDHDIIKVETDGNRTYSRFRVLRRT